MSIFEESLELHAKFHGKLSISSKVPLADKKDLSLAYTPGVAEVCREIARNPDSVKNLTIKKNTVAVVSDGSAILGLGNLGAAAAIPVMEGKAALFKEFADIDAFPICLDTQSPEEIITAVKQIAPVFGGINLEDIAAPKCFDIERRLREELDIPVMHDDQHGTAVVVLAALINALKLKNMQPHEPRVVINGAGAAGTAVAELLLAYGVHNIVICDSKGVIHHGRTDLNEEKQALARITNMACLEGLDASGCVIGTLETAVRGADVFIGVSAANILSGDMVRAMNPQPIIFAMANPTPEIMPDVAIEAGAYIVATGRSDFANQINNVLAFPGIFRGALDNNVRIITEEMLTNAARAIAACVKNPTPEYIIPPVFDRSVVPAVAATIK